MEKVNRKPLLAGLLNVLIPGSSRLYVNQDWIGFIKAFVLGSLAMGIAVFGGDTIQHTREYTLPQGLCVGSLVLIVVIVLFLGGLKTARDRNGETNAAAFYNSKRPAVRKNGETKQP